jgi:WD40 repeat protein
LTVAVLTSAFCCGTACSKDAVQIPVDDPQCVAFSPDGSAIVVGRRRLDSEPLLQVRDVKTGKLTKSLKGHSRDVRGVEFLPNGKAFVSASRDGTVRIWEYPSCRELAVLKLPRQAQANALAVSPDGTLIATGSDGAVHLWSVDEHKLVAELSPAPLVYDVAFLSTGKVVAAVGDGPTIYRWTVAQKKPMQQLTGHLSSESITEIVTTRDGLSFATSGTDSKVLIWSGILDEPRQTLTFQYAGPSIAFFPDGKRLAVGQQGAVEIYGVGDGARIGSISLPRRNTSLSAIRLSSDGNKLAGRTKAWVVILSIKEGVESKKP